MDISKTLGVFLLILVYAYCSDESIETQELEASTFMRELNEEVLVRRNRETIAEWAYASNITDENERIKTEISVQNAEFYKLKAQELRKYDYNTFQDEDLKRQFKKYSDLGYAALPDNEYRELLDAVSKMESNYAKVKVCAYNNTEKCNLSLEPEIEEVYKKSRNPEELKHFWVEWYNKAGAPVRRNFDKYIELGKKAANLNNFTSMAEAWLDSYEDNTFEQQLENIFEQIRQLYEQLHGYVRYRLNQVYGDDIVSKDGPIPMHLLGNMWAQEWTDIADLILPYPEKPSIDVTNEMVEQGYTAIKMFEMGDAFFQSINMTKLPQKFWDNSILEKPKDGRELVCHASAWDFFTVDDVRIKQCTRVNMEQLFTVHHELGHIQYYLQYQNLPAVYREGANPGFHEAVGDVLSLSVSTPKHLQKIGLLKDYNNDMETRINQLFRTGLEKIIFLPFAFTMDKYRWAIFRGEIKPEDYNCAFWKLRDEYSGIEPPVKRSKTDFDAAAKYHVSADVEYLRYMVSYIIQFQFYEAACKLAGEFDPTNSSLPLDNCDFYEHPEAGNVFKSMLALGSSKPWPDAMEVMTGQRKMDASALVNYFQPLRIWLETENKKNNVHIGWKRSDKCE